MQQLLVEVHASRRRQAKEVLPLAYPDDDTDTGCEPDDYRTGDEAQHSTQLGHAKQDENDSGHAGGQQQPVDAIFRGDAGEDDDESSCRPRDLNAGSPEQRHHQAGNDRRVNTLFGLHARSDGERHGERQRHHAHDDASDEVACPLIASQQSCFCRFNYCNHPEDLILL